MNSTTILVTKTILMAITIQVIVSFSWPVLRSNFLSQSFHIVEERKINL
ncbi:hypothetical protein [Anaerobacillus arseniciselenatis]|nr:hypothetical protein [Anaerobacillus arseniciselenatis]